MSIFYKKSNKFYPAVVMESNDKKFKCEMADLSVSGKFIIRSALYKDFRITWRKGWSLYGLSKKDKVVFAFGKSDFSTPVKNWRMHAAKK